MTQSALPSKHLSLATRLLSALFWVYKGATANRRPACRFTPSCSEYGHEAVRRFGARAALPLVAKRLISCRPGGPFGYDPVPDTLPARKSGKRASRRRRQRGDRAMVRRGELD
ncbi:MAG: membrane protein insertion efficiency factor YidD [Actinomycetota bacterium]|nr:membrane protein insertion efficiency factor YidD [Actinomycetota bacterium]